MSALSINPAPLTTALNVAASVDADQTGESTSERVESNRTENERFSSFGDRPLSEEVTALQEAFNAEFSADNEEANSPPRTVLDFVNAQFSSGDLSDDSVAFLLDIAARELNTGSTLEQAINDPFGINRTNDEGSSEDGPQSLASVLQLARDTFQLVRESDTPLGFRASLLSETLEGLQGIRISA